MNCPKKYELVRAKKVVTSPPSASGDEGTRVHALIEDYFNTGVMDLELVKYKRLLETYYTKDGKAEAEYAFKWVDNELVRCEMDDPDVWFRAILDWVKVDEDNKSAEVADWKTGRVKPSKQLQLYAWIIFLAYPTVEKVKCTFHWINYNDQLPQWFHRKDMEKLFQPFQEILDQIDHCYQTDIWLEIPGEIQKSTGRGTNCRFCPVTQEHCSNGLPIIPEAA
jgi:hypothetical protein